MIKIYKNIKILFSAKEGIQLLLLLLLYFLAVIVETLGVASILPYITLLVSPDSELAQKVIDYVSLIAKEDNKNIIIKYVGYFVLCTFSFGTLILGMSSWYTLRFAMQRIDSISKIILLSYLERDYEYFLAKNSASFLQNILSEVASVVGGVITPIIQAITRILLVIVLVSMLIAVDYSVAISVIAIFSTFYLILYAYKKSELSKLGSDAQMAKADRYRVLIELFSGIREVKLWALENVYFHKYSIASQRFSQAESKSQLISLLPRYAFEIIAFGGMLIVTLVLVDQNKNFTEVIPLLSLYAVAANKLLPSLQQIFLNIATIKYNANSLDTLIKEINHKVVRGEKNIDKPNGGINFRDEIRFEHVEYKYPEAQENAVGPVSFKIKANSITGVYGKSGAGKSTILDMMLGLIKPTGGKIIIDGVDSNIMNREWRSIVACVPQNTFLIEATVAENIAYGVPPNQIDYSKLTRVAQIAKIDTYLESLPEKYKTMISENGKNMSGGQRQRLAIARALYRDPAVLVFDEATSALDVQTEEDILLELKKLKSSKTIIIVTHKLSVLKDCDRVYFIENGLLIEKENNF